MWWLLGLAGAALALRVVLHFPWRDTGAALVGVNGWLLLAALVVNLVSPVAKAWGWHVLLGAVAPNRWWVAQEANLVGTAVNIVGVGVSGEAARVSLLVRRDHVPMRAAVLSVVGAPVNEDLGLETIVVMARFRVWGRLVARLPRSLRSSAMELAQMGWGGRLIVPTALAMVNWVAQWGCYYLVLRAAHIDAPPAAAFTAVIAVNLGGIVRFTPANVGVTQAAMAGALLPFGVAAEQGVAAGLALQGIQVLPILAFGLAIAGRSGLKRLLAEERDLAQAA